jgi:hypothetical protein
MKLMYKGEAGLPLGIRTGRRSLPYAHRAALSHQVRTKHAAYHGVKEGCVA